VFEPSAARQAALFSKTRSSAAQCHNSFGRQLRKESSKPHLRAPSPVTPLVDFKVQLIDGSYHNVDSDEHSFRAAGRKAFRTRWKK
jgi:hypothetical protein